MPGLEILLGTITAVTTTAGVIATYRLFKSQSSEAATKTELDSARHRYRQALREIESCHVLEDLYAIELEGLGAGAAQTIKNEFRGRVETLGYDRPSWRPSKVKDENRWLGDAPHRQRPAPAPGGPIATVLAKHLDRALSGENSPIRPILNPPIPESDPAPTREPGKGAPVDPVSRGPEVI